MKRLPSSIAMVSLVAMLATGCAKQQESTDTATRAREVERTREPEKPRFETVVIPVGTSVVASLATPLSTETSHAGDAFTAKTTEAIIVNGKNVVPAGTSVHGVVRDVQPSGRTSGRAQMTLDFQTIVDPTGKTHSITAVPLTLQAASATHDDVEKIAAGSVLGAVIGGIAGGKKGAAIGAGAGAGAGIVLMLATKGDEIELEPGQKVNVQMTSATSIPVLAQM